MMSKVFFQVLSVLVCVVAFFGSPITAHGEGSASMNVESIYLSADPAKDILLILQSAKVLSRDNSYHIADLLCVAPLDSEGETSCTFKDQFNNDAPISIHSQVARNLFQDLNQAGLIGYKDNKESTTVELDAKQIQCGFWVEGFHNPYLPPPPPNYLCTITQN